MQYNIFEFMNIGAPPRTLLKPGGFHVQILSLAAPRSPPPERSGRLSKPMVVLPNASIEADEIADEPGTASSTVSGWTSPNYLSTGLNVLSRRSLTVPADGYLLVLATFRVQISNLSLFNARGFFGVALDDSTQVNGNQDVDLNLPSGMPGTVDLPVTVHGLFAVTPGTHRAYATAHISNGSYQVSDVQLTLLYIPTAYGTIGAQTSQHPSNPHIEERALTSQR